MASGWFVGLSLFAIGSLIGSVILSSMAANAAGNGNISTATSFSVWSAVLSALAAILVIIAAFFIGKRTTFKGSGLRVSLLIVTILAILFLIGATALSVMSAAASDPNSIRSNAIWAAVVSAIGGFLVLIGLILSIYRGREEIVTYTQGVLGAYGKTLEEQALESRIARLEITQKELADVSKRSLGIDAELVKDKARLTEIRNSRVVTQPVAVKTAIPPLIQQQMSQAPKPGLTPGTYAIPKTSEQTSKSAESLLGPPSPCFKPYKECLEKGYSKDKCDKDFVKCITDKEKTVNELERLRPNPFPV